MKGSYVLGLDVGGSSVKAVAMTPAGERLAQAQGSFDPDRRLGFAETARDLAEQLAAERCGAPSAVGLSAPGLVNPHGRAIAHLPNRLPGMEGLDWTAWLGGKRAVLVLNDAQAALVGETWLGAARGRTNVVLLTLGTGVGGAAMVDGHVLRGHVGKAGHLGHISLNPEGPPDICGTPGSLELAIGNCTIAARTGGRFVSTHDLLRAHRAGDAEATRVWLTSVRALAVAVVSLTNVLDPEVMVIGGGVAQAGDALFLPLRSAVAAMEWQVGGQGVRIVPAQLGELAGAYGAACHALQRQP